MSLPIPLSVTLQTSRRTMRITNQVMDLQFRSTVPGGFASAGISLNRPLTLAPDEIAYYGRLLIHDARTGRVAWEGRLEDPGRSAGADGTVWDLAAIGPSGHARDRKVPLIYVDQSTERWRRYSPSQKSARIETDSDDDDVPTLTISFDEGQTVGANSTGAVQYRALRETGQKLGRVRSLVTSGGTSSSWEDQLVTQPSGTLVHNLTWNTTPRFVFGERGGAQSIPSGDDIPVYRIQRLATGVATANSWSEFADIIVRAMLVDRNGNDITSGYDTNTVFAHEIVADLLGRLLTQYDGPNATIATNAFPIDQLAYPDGVTSAELLDDLMQIELDHFWAAWEAGSNDLYRFEWTPWPTTIAYEADVTDGYSSTGSAEGLYNRVNVRWRSPQGNIRIRAGTQTVPELDDAGIVREETIDLGDNIASSTLGDQARDNFLADHAAAPNAGSLTVARPILDAASGMLVPPWLIRPGKLIRVRGILPREDSLNATARDGVTVFRVVSSTFSAKDAAATLELDSFAPSTARAIADLQQTRRRR